MTTNRKLTLLELIVNVQRIRRVTYGRVYGRELSIIMYSPT